MGWESSLFFVFVRISKLTKCENPIDAREHYSPYLAFPGLTSIRVVADDLDERDLSEYQIFVSVGPQN